MRQAVDKANIWSTCGTVLLPFFLAVAAASLIFYFYFLFFILHKMHVSITMVRLKNKKQIKKKPLHFVILCLGVLYLHCCTACSAGGVAYSNAYFSAGIGPIFLDDVQCTSIANQILECSSRPILTHNCLHSADAGVKCEGIYILRSDRFSYMLHESVLYIYRRSMHNR